MIRILHTGDVHLDTPFSGLDPKLAAKRRDELRQTFSSIVKYARDTAIDLFLIAGDLTDQRFATSETVRLVADELATLKCPVVIAPGNHDPADGRGIWSSTDFSPNVHIFTEERVSRVSLDEIGTDIYGYAFTSPELTTSPLIGEFVHESDRINILLCHGDMASPVSKYAPISKEQLAAFGADYAALGHIHDPLLYGGIAGKCTYAYCGCPEGRDFGECGELGAAIVEITQDGSRKSVNVTHKRFCRRVYADIRVPLAGAASETEIVEAVRTAVAGLERDTVLRLTLTGIIADDAAVDPDRLTAALPEFYSVTIRDETTPSLAFAEGDMSIRGEYCRLLAPMLSSADEKERRTAVLALRMGLSALAGESAEI